MTGARKDLVFSGMRPTGRLHIGNYWGALKNWVDLQEKYNCFFMVADYHMLTTGYDDTTKLQANSHEMILDWLAAGVDPAKAVIFRQSDVIEHAELALLLGMITPLRWCEDNPTWKEQLQDLAKTKERLMSETVAEIVRSEGKHLKQHGSLPESAVQLDDKEIRRIEEERARAEELRTYGFLGYAVLQAADILLYHGTKVPVGQDQLPHLEISRQIARRFNNLYGQTFTEPQPMLTPTPKVPGNDGRKMSKSYGNTVDIYETKESLQKKAMAMYTDPTKVKKDDPGNPEPCEKNPPGCTVFALHKLYASEEFVAKRKVECTLGQIGCVACKKDLLAEMDKPFAEFRHRREKYAKDQFLVPELLASGANKARSVAQKTMEEVRKAMRLS